MSNTTCTIAVLGAGTMGRGIAQNAAASGCSVRLFDTSAERVGAGRDAIDAALAKLVEKGKLPGREADVILARIEAGTDRTAAVKDADVVIEAAPEDMQLKRALFEALGR